jgi:hypothetical protein
LYLPVWKKKTFWQGLGFCPRRKYHAKKAPLLIPNPPAGRTDPAFGFGISPMVCNGFFWNVPRNILAE